MAKFIFVINDIFALYVILTLEKTLSVQVVVFIDIYLSIAKVYANNRILMIMIIKDDCILLFINDF